MWLNQGSWDQEIIQHYPDDTRYNHKNPYTREVRRTGRKRWHAGSRSCCDVLWRWRKESQTKKCRWPLRSWKRQGYVSSPRASRRNAAQEIFDNMLLWNLKFMSINGTVFIGMRFRNYEDITSILSKYFHFKKGEGWDCHFSSL